MSKESTPSLGHRAFPRVLAARPFKPHEARQFGYEFDLGLRRHYLERESAPIVLVHEDVRDRSFLKQWEHTACIITHPKLSARIQRSKAYSATFTPHEMWQEAHDTHACWGRIRGSRQPMMALPPPLPLSKVFEGLGIPDNAFIVALDIHEGGYVKRKDAVTRYYKQLCGGIIDTYLEAIYSITARGGWVLRLGSSQSRRLPQMDRVVDLNGRELFNLSALRYAQFFISCDSPSEPLALSLGVPILRTNVATIEEFPLRSCDRYLPKLYRRMVTKELIPFAEVHEDSRIASRDPETLDRANIEIVDNSPDELISAIDEMIQIAFEPAKFESPHEVQRKFGDAVGIPNEMPAVPLAYLLKHQQLL